MDGIKVTDYSIFDTATSTTNILIKKINEMKDIIESAISTLSDGSIFEGPICNECLNALNDSMAKLESMTGNCENVKNHFNEAYTKYKNGDREGADNVLSVKFWDRTGSTTPTTPAKK